MGVNVVGVASLGSAIYIDGNSHQADGSWIQIAFAAVNIPAANSLLHGLSSTFSVLSFTNGAFVTNPRDGTSQTVKDGIGAQATIGLCLAQGTNTCFPTSSAYQQIITADTNTANIDFNWAYTYVAQSVSPTSLTQVTEYTVYLFVSTTYGQSTSALTDNSGYFVVPTTPNVYLNSVLLQLS
jgi:hypothetical protein